MASLQAIARVFYLSGQWGAEYVFPLCTFLAGVVFSFAEYIAASSLGHSGLKEKRKKRVGIETLHASNEKKGDTSVHVFSLVFTPVPAYPSRKLASSSLKPATR
eukprot:1138407-Pelagomonas_calceolata.AAC.2